MCATGTVALSGSLVDAFETLFAARIPKDWLKKSWEAANLGSWFAGLLARHDQLAKWLLHGRPKSFWLTGFFNPQVRSATARQAAQAGGHREAACDTVARPPGALHTPAASPEWQSPSCAARSWLCQLQLRGLGNRGLRPSMHACRAS